LTGRSLHIAIAGEAIPYVEGGLGHFLFKAIQEMSEAEPNWRFTVVATSSFKELANIRKPNVNFIYWGESLPRRATAKFLRALFPAPQAWDISYDLSQRIPSRRLRARWGNLRAIWGTLSDVDAVWVPHFSINSPHLSPMRNLDLVRAPILFTIHDIHPVAFPDDWSKEALNSFWNGFAPFARRSEHVITHSEFQRAAIIEHLKVAADRVSTVPCPPLIEPATLLQPSKETDSDALLARHRISKPFALYPGSTTHTHKNHSRLLLAWSELKERLGPECPTLVCTSKGHLWPAFRSLIEALGIGDKVVFTDLIETGELTTLYQNCAFVIVPTLYEGGGSGPVIEAILLGKPVLCSRIPPIEEQLHSYGVSNVTFFAPDSVESIARAVESTLENFQEVTSEAVENQRRLLPKVSQLWDEWTHYYLRKLRSMADG
jgi:glycosyltransferase involved in cell wall biosynthesis